MILSVCKVHSGVGFPAGVAAVATWTQRKYQICCALQDLLNNLESCDLDDDDLMLDADVSEDASLHSGMSPSA